MDKNIFWKVLLDMAVIVTWILSVSFITEYLINRQSDTALAIACLFIIAILTYFLFKKVFKKI